MSCFIGIDLGASFVKGALFDIDKLEISNIIKFSSPQPKIYSKEPPFLRFETNPSSYEKIVKQLINRYLKQVDDIRGIVFSTQMHGMVLIDSKFAPITTFIGWQDERLLEKSPIKSKTWADLFNSRIKDVDYSLTGIKLKSGLMGSTLFWLKENGVLGKYKDAKALFLGDYIAARLSKGAAFVDPTNACGSGVFDVKKGKWSNNILAKTGIDISYMPITVPTGTITGYMKILNSEIPIYVSVGDLQSAVLGSFVKSTKKDVGINIGTGSQVSLISTKFNKGNYDIRSYFDNEYLYTVTNIPAGRSLNVLIKFIEDIGHKIFNANKKVDVWTKIGKILKNQDRSNNLKAGLTFFKNNFTGLETGSFTNITEDNWTLANMFISAFECMAANYKIAYDRLRKNNSKGRIIFSGGLARKFPLLRIITKEKLKKESCLAPYDEEALIGLFIISLFIAKKFKNIGEASLYCKNHNIVYKKPA